MIKIRRVQPEDQAQILLLIDEIMSKEFHDQKGAYPNGDIQDVTASYGSLGEAFFVAAQNGHIVGTVGIKKEDDRVAFLRRLFVSASHRNQQIGRKLIERAIQFCDEVGYEEVIFKTTSRMEGAIKMCQKCGFAKRAQIHLGPVELYKFSLLLKELPKAKNS